MAKIHPNIIELAEAAIDGIPDKYEFDFQIFLRIFTEEFALRIINKCADLMEEEDSHYGELMGNVIKTHFGVTK